VIEHGGAEPSRIGSIYRLCLETGFIDQEDEEAIG
jgi:hypothetical protein